MVHLYEPFQFRWLNLAVKLDDYTDESKEILKDMGVDAEEDDAVPCRFLWAFLLKYFIEVCLNYRCEN